MEYKIQHIVNDKYWNVRGHWEFGYNAYGSTFASYIVALREYERMGKENEYAIIIAA